MCHLICMQLYYLMYCILHLATNSVYTQMVADLLLADEHNQQTSYHRYQCDTW